MSGQGPEGSPGRVSGADDRRVFAMTPLYGLLLGAVTGAVSGTIAAPVLGTVVGALLGAALALPVSLIAAAVIGPAARPPGTAVGYRRRVDITLVVLAVATALLAVGWISLDPLVGPWPALAMLIVVIVGLVAVRPRLHRLGPLPPA